MCPARAALQQSTVDVLRCIEPIFSDGDPKRADEYWYVASEKNHHVGFVSSGYQKVWGCAPEILQHDPMAWMGAIHPEDLQRVKTAFGARVKAGTMDVEYRIMRTDGQMRYIQDRSRLFPGGSDGRPFVVGRCRDITAMRVAQSAIKEQQEQIEERDLVLREITETIDDVMWIWDAAQGSLMYVGKAFERVWGRNRPDLFNDPNIWYEGIHPEDRDAVDNLFAVPARNERFVRQYRVLRSDGRVSHVREHVFSIVDDQGRVKRLAGLASDITQDLQAEESRLQLALEHAARQNAEGQVQARDEVLAVVSHDLRNPLFAIATLVRRLSKPLSEEKRLQCVAGLQRTLDRTNHLIEDLLDASRIEPNQFAVQSESVDPKVLIEQTVESFADWPGGEHITLSAEVERTLEPVMGDRYRLQQVLTNLITNAYKFTPAGGEIAVRACRDGDNVLFSVSDTGCGISDIDKNRLFERFWQADRRDRRGAGLGLCIAKGIIDAHRGSIWIESKQHVGTQCFFTIGLQAAQKAAT